jgi:hypothetical protein
MSGVRIQRHNPRFLYHIILFSTNALHVCCVIVLESQDIDCLEGKATASTAVQ